MSGFEFEYVPLQLKTQESVVGGRNFGSIEKMMKPDPSTASTPRDTLQTSCYMVLLNSQKQYKDSTSFILFHALQHLCATSAWVLYYKSISFVMIIQPETRSASPPRIQDFPDGGDMWRCCESRHHPKKIYPKFLFCRDSPFPSKSGSL